MKFPKALLLILAIAAGGYAQIPDFTPPTLLMAAAVSPIR